MCSKHTLWQKTNIFSSKNVFYPPQKNWLRAWLGYKQDLVTSEKPDMLSVEIRFHSCVWTARQRRRMWFASATLVSLCPLLQRVSSLGLSTNDFVIQPFMNTFRFTHSVLVHAGGHITDTTLTRRPTGLWPCCSLNCMFSRAFSCLLLQACFPCIIRNPIVLSPVCPVAMERRLCA